MSFDPTGYTLAHEHLHIDLSGFKNNVDCRLDQYAFICQEMNDLMTRGVRNVIEMTNRYMGRNAQFMLDVMRETGINVVACTGYYQDAFFPEHVATRSVQELAQEMVDEIEQGIDGTELKAGIIAEIGTSANIAKASGPTGYSAEVEILEGWTRPNRRFNFSPAAEYNKFYFEFCGAGYAVTTGEVMRSHARYRIDTIN